MVIGISGKAGSGKTTLSNMFVEKYSLIKLDCDDIAKELQTKLGFKINVDNNGFIDDKEQKRIIDEFHPLVWNEIESQLEKQTERNKESKESIDCVIETALPSDRFFDIVDISFCIKSDYSKDRMKQSRIYSDQKIEAIIKSQKAYNKYYDKCDFIITNNENIHTAFDKICDIYESIKGKDK